MPAQLTIKLTNRSPKQGIKKLPPSIDVPPNATVDDLKILIARATKIGDHNRLGIYDPSTKKTLKNRKALLKDEQSVIKAGEVLVKDMGPQIAWRTVFVIEYLGPILIHPAIIALRPYLFNGGDQPMSSTQWLSMALIVLHFIKRELETLFVHKFSANTMPVFNVFKNSFFYWAVSGLLCALAIYYPSSLAATAAEPIVDLVGIALYLFGETGNGLIHWYLSSLRSTGGTERKIPVGFGFALVTCPNYMFEIISWLGVIVVSRNWAVILFIALGGAQMYTWAKGKERAYRKEFGDKYKSKRFVMLPGLL